MSRTRTGLLISDKSLKNLDGRKKEAKVLRGIIDDLEGTLRDVSSPKRRLIERASFMIYRVAQYEFRYLTGQPMTADDERIYQGYCKILHTYLTTLGIERQEKDVITLEQAIKQMRSE